MRRRRVLPSPETRRHQDYGERCTARHPIWHGVRCERQATRHGMAQHITHHSQARQFEWTDERTQY